MNEIFKTNPSFKAYENELKQCVRDFGSSGKLLFQGRNTVKAFTLSDGTRIVVKRFGRLIWLRRLIYSTVCRTKARRAYDNGLGFISLGFETPEPVAYAEYYHKGLLSDCYFISLHSDARPAFDRLVEAERFDTSLAGQVAELMANLHKAGAMHGDPNLNNILYYEAPDGTTRLTLIDTNRSAFRRTLSRQKCLKNLMRVTHRRDLMREIAGRYAVLRGYDPVKTVGAVIGMLEKFERNRALRHRLKSLFKSLR